MKNRKKLLWTLIPILAVVAVGAVILLFSSTSRPLEATVLKVGKADASVIRFGSHTVVIDTGEQDDSEELLSVLKEKGAQTIDLLILTHFDKDHIGGAAELIKRSSIERIILPDYTPENEDSEAYTALTAALENTSASIQRASDDFTLTIEQVSFTVNTAKGKVYPEKTDNNNSLVTIIRNGSDVLLFAGDIERDRIGDLLEENIGQCVFLKVPHHGVYDEYSERFFKAVYPTYAAVCCSEKNPPDDRILSLLEGLSVKTYLTMQGDITVTSTSHGLTVSQ